MQGIERAYCDVCIHALIKAWRGLMEVFSTETLRSVRYGNKGAKSDTLGLDAIPEIIIQGWLNQYDKHAILITEELDAQTHGRWPTDADPIKQPLMFFCDPTDRSKQLKMFFERLAAEDPMAKIGSLMATHQASSLWEEMFESPASITGSNTAITCVRKGKVVFSVILNYITSTMYVATDIGVHSFKLKIFTDPTNETITLTHIAVKDNILSFPGASELEYSPDDCKRFTTFLGKSGYRENFNDSMLFVDNPDSYLHHEEPPGPSRALYLSELQNQHGPIGFIMANGEKISEWIHWLAFVKFAKNSDGDHALRAFEISLERPWTKNGILMSTAPPYSIFCGDDSDMYLDISRLKNFDRPSQFRSMLVVVRYDNERIIHVLSQHKYREVTESF